MLMLARIGLSGEQKIYRTSGPLLETRRAITATDVDEPTAEYDGVLLADGMWQSMLRGDEGGVRSGVDTSLQVAGSRA